MADFGHLKKYEVQENETREFSLWQLEGEPVLHVLPATEVNKPFFNAVLRNANKVKSFGGKRTSADSLAAMTVLEKAIYAKHVVKGWSGVTEKNGEEVPFTAENAEEFLNVLPKHIYSDLRAFVMDINNFLPDDNERLEVDEALVKNSKRGSSGK